MPYTDISQQNGGKKVIKKYNSKYDFRHQNYLIEVYYPDNKIFSRGYRVHDTMNGHWQWWYENGKLRDEAYLDKGFYVRERKHWYDNGNLKQIEKIYGKCADNEDCCNGEVVYFRKDGSIDQKFKNGQVIDTVFIYYENGKLSIEECMKYDVRNGKYIDFYRNGSKQTEGNCLNDIKVGKWTYYDSLGKIDSMVEY